jgi:hypothetical protein
MNKIITDDISPTFRLNAFERLTKTSVWPGYVGCIWALIYAVFVRFYEAAGGITESYGQLKDPEPFQMVSYFAGVLIMFCGFVLLGLVKPWGKVVPSWVPLFGGRKIHRLIILVPTLFCTAYLIAHGVAGMITKVLFLAGAITINVQTHNWIVIDMHSLALWDLLFYEPWFLIMGILAGLTAAHYAQASGVSLSTLRRNTVLFLIIVFLLTALLVSSIVFDFVDKISF